jgi:hypothetical protein
MGRHGRVFAFACALATAACGAAAPDLIQVNAISSETQEPVPCAIYVDGARQVDASGAPLATPAAIAVAFRPDPTGAHESAGVKISVFPLITADGKFRLPVEGTSDPAPSFRFDRHAERVIHRSDARSQLFLLLPNGDGRWYELPSRGATISADS